MKKTTPKTKTTKSSSKVSAAGARTKRHSVIPLFQTGRDARDAILVVSVAINLFMVCLWVILQKTSMYDQALFDFFIHR